jgi:hypothetical protein
MISYWSPNVPILTLDKQLPDRALLMAEVLQPSETVISISYTLLWTLPISYHVIQAAHFRNWHCFP